jgi:hypothetical protein
VIETLAQSEAELREHVRSLQEDVESYRAALIEAISALHRVTTERDAARQQARAISDEFRLFRARLLGPEQRAA